MTTVLVIEDDLEINELLGEYLALENIGYVQATTGQAGVHHALTGHPDAIVLDLMLPDIDGYEVARTLSNRRATHDIPIVILSCMCQDCDRNKGYQSGALFYMNKPFLPDDLLATLRRALDWKQSLPTRPASGTITMGNSDVCACNKSINEMIAELFEKTDLSDAAVTQIREMTETLAQWATEWNTQHPSQSHLKLEYRVGIEAPLPTNGSAGTNGNATNSNGSKSSGPIVEWKMTEDAPGMLAEAFFSPPPSGTQAGGGMIGWGTTALVSKPLAPIAPPAQWLQVLAKAGAARFEKDSRNQTVRFFRPASGAALSSTTLTVPVVEIDGLRFPTRLRDEALAAKRK